VLASPNGLNHIGLVGLSGQWMHLRRSGRHVPVSAGEAILLRPSDIDQIIQQSWIWAQ
jgi:hypothetical protein